MASERPAPSLRRALLAWLVLPLVVLVPLATALLYLLAVQPAMDSLDRALTDTTVALAQILDERDGQAVLPLSPQTAHALRADLVDEVVFAVGDAHGGLLGGDRALLALDPQPARGAWRFFDGTLRGQAMRVVAHGAACGTQTCAILVAESLGKRSAAARAVALAALGVSLLLAVCLALLARVAVGHGLRPLQRASQELERRSLQQLDPLPLQHLPREVAFFGAAINALFGRLRTAVGAQRSFLDDASHQLRTPLTTLATQVAYAQREADPAAQREVLETIREQLDETIRQTNQMLSLARADSAPPQRQPFDAVALAEALVRQWWGPARDQGVDLGLDAPDGPLPLQGEPDLLREALSNLLHNAIRHGGAGCHVTLVVRGEAHGAVQITVVDNGPGLPPDELARAGERFFRGRGGALPGSGLGLAIVRTVAQRHGGQMRVGAGPEGRGLAVTLTMPAQPVPGVLAG